MACLFVEGTSVGVVLKGTNHFLGTPSQKMHPFSAHVPNNMQRAHASYYGGLGFKAGQVCVFITGPWSAWETKRVVYALA